MSGGVPIDPRQIEEIRDRVSIESVVGRVVKLRKAGRGYKGLCPFHVEKSPSFSVSPDRGRYHCFGCGADGDVIGFVMAAQRVSFREAVEALAADGGVSLGPVLPPEGGRRDRRGTGGYVDSATAGRWMWRASRPARRTIVERWLDARGLDLGAFGIGDGIDRLRFLPDAPAAAWRVDEDPRRYWLRAPAMIAPVSDGEGHVRAIHVTYLTADGRAKADFPPTRDGDERDTRKMYGPVGGRAVWLSGMPEEAPGRPLFVGEGIETCWSYAQRWAAEHLGRSARVAAALSLENLQGGVKKIACRDGSAWRLWRIEADLDRAPFLIGRAGEVHVLVDADMKPLRDQVVQRHRHGRIERGDIGQAERADICAALATQHWRAAGAAPVIAMRPPMGMDFNDLARATGGAA
ncbi:CHC2 zinc finger domain-containing protein [Rhizorhabdus wittichii]